MADKEFNPDWIRDHEKLYQANALPPQVRSDYEKMRPSLLEQLQDQDRTFVGALGESVSHAPSDAYQVGKETMHAIMHPIETAQNINDLVAGVLYKMGGTAYGASPENAKKVDAVAADMIESYGSWQAIKKSIATHPVHVLTDISTLLGGGELAAAKTLGKASAVTEGLSKAAKYTNPLTPAAGLAKLGGKFATETTGRIGGMGGANVEEAARAGYEGGEPNKAFKRHFNQEAPRREPVDVSRDAVAVLERRKNASYAMDIQSTKDIKTVLSWNSVEAELNDIDREYTRGGYDNSPTTQPIRDGIRALVEEWKGRRASEWSTPQGFDDLKKRIWEDFASPTSPGRPGANPAQHHVAMRMYDAVRGEITRNARDYARVMQAYEQANQLIDELKRELSLGRTATVGTALRKIQSVMRNNVNTAWGYRGELIEMLKDAGAENVLAMVAGQNMDSWMPRGLAGGAFAGYETAQAIKGEGLGNWRELLGLVASPKMVGHIANKGGQVARYLYKGRPYLPAAYRAGQLDEEVQQNLDNPSGIPLQ